MAWLVSKRRATGNGLSVALLSAVLAGCAAITGGEPAPDIYTLSAPRDFGGTVRASRAQILIAAPHAVSALDSQNIAVVSNGIEITYFGKSAWSDSVPRLLQRKMIEAFQNSGGVRAVGQPGEGLLIDYQIATDIRSFQLDVDGGRVATVEFAAKIVNDRNGRVLATRTFRAQSRAATDTTADAVEAIDRASDECLVDLVNWVLGKI